MPRKSNKDFHLKSIIDGYTKNLNSGNVADVVTFSESMWGLNSVLLPVQRFILKCYYGLELDNIIKNIPIKDLTGSKLLYTMTESEFMSYLINEGRTNLKEYNPGKPFRELVLCAGRRGSKCCSVNSEITTTIGTITYGELLKRKSNGEKIGIFTYDCNTWQKYITYDIHAESNGSREVIEITTSLGRKEQATFEHPYLIVRNNKPEWVKLKDINIGDRIAISECQDLFGNQTIGNTKAKLLGHLCGSGKIYYSEINYVAKNNIVMNDFKKCVNEVFPKTIINQSDNKFVYNILQKNYIDNYSLNEWSNDIGLIEEARIPSCIKKTSYSESILFLNRLYGSGGYIRSSRSIDSDKQVCIGIRLGKDMVHDVQRELLKHGIISKIKYCNRKYRNQQYEFWKVIIDIPESLLKFINEIGMYGHDEQLSKIKQICLCNLSEKSDFFIPGEYTSMLSWDVVTELSYSGVKETVALEVDNTNIIGNDIISHNSTISSIISNYEVYKLVKMGNPQAYYGIPEGQPIGIKSVATSDDQAQELFDMIRAKGLGCKYINDRIVNYTQTFFNMQTDHDIDMFGLGKKATISLQCGGSYSVSLRGGNNIMVIFDEAAFFIENGGRFSGTEVYRALTPSVASFVPKHLRDVEGASGDGKIINLSSPYGKSGVFWDVYNRSFEEPDMLMFKLYTALMNPTIDSSLLTREYRRDKQIFMCEYGGEFSDSISNWINDKDRFYQNVDKTVKKNPRKGSSGVGYYMGIDIGLKNDGTGISIVHREQENIVVDWANVYFSSSSDVWNKTDSIYKDCRELCGYEILPMYSIAERIKELSKWFPLKGGSFDQEQGFSLMEILKKMGLGMFTMEHTTQGKNTEMYQAVKSLLNDNMIKFFDHPVLIPEILSLEESKNGAHIKVAAPNRMGLHDDISCACVRAIYQCYKDTGEHAGYKSITFGRGGNVLTSESGDGFSSYRSYRNQKIINHGDYGPRNIGKIGLRSKTNNMLLNRMMRTWHKNRNNY